MNRLEVTTGIMSYGSKYQDFEANSSLREQFVSILDKVAQASKTGFDMLQIKNISIEISGDRDVIIIEADKIIEVDLNTVSKELKQEVASTLAVINRLDLIKNKEAVVGLSTVYKFKFFDERSFLDGIGLYFKRMFCFIFTCRPAIANLLSNELKNIKIEGLEHTYINKNDLFRKIKQNLEPKIFELYNSAEIDNLINAEFIRQTNKLLASNNKEVWDTQKMGSLDLERHIKTLKSKPDALYLIQQLRHADPLKVPYKLLAELTHIRNANDMLLNLWPEFLNGIYARGKFAESTDEFNTEDLLHQAASCDVYYEAFAAIPNNMKEGLVEYLKTKNYKLPEEVQEIVLKNQTKHIQKNGNVDFGPLTEVFRKDILDNFHGNINDVFNDENGLSHLLSTLAGNVNQTYKITNILKPEKKINKESVRSMIEVLRSKLSLDEKTFFTEERLIRLFISELEREASTNFHLLSSQITALKGLRQERNDNYGVKSFLGNLWKPFNLNQIYDKIFTDEIIDGLRTSHEEYQLTSDQQRALMRIERLFQKSEALNKKYNNAVDSIRIFEPNKDKYKMSDYELLQMNNDIEKLLKVKNIDTLLSKFLVRKSPSIKSYLNFFPKFTHGIIEKLFLENPFPELITPGAISPDSILMLKKHIEVMNTYKYKEKNIRKLIAKGKSLIQKFKTNPDLISKNERLTLKEMGCLNEFSRITLNFNVSKHAYLDVMNKHNDEMKDFINLNKEATDTYAQIEKLIISDLEKDCKNGSILAYSEDKKLQFTGRSSSIDERVTGYLGGYSHGIKLYRFEGDKELEGKIFKSEIMSVYSNSQLDLYPLLISDLWEFDLSPLMNDHVASILQDIYGDDWQTFVNSKFQAFEHKIHKTYSVEKGNNGKKVFHHRFDAVLNSNDEVESGMYNNFNRRIRAATADFPRISSLFFNDIKSHKRETPRNFDEIHRRFLKANTGNATKGDEKQICSEFVSKSTIASMSALNEFLTREISNHIGKKYSKLTLLGKMSANNITPSNEVKAYLDGKRFYKKEFTITEKAEKELIEILKTCGYDSNEIDLIIRLGNKEVFDSPYSKYLSLKTIHPSMMIELLKDKNCIVKKTPMAVSKLIAA